MTAQSLPPELERFVEEQVASGTYRSEQDLFVSAVRVLRDVQARQAIFHEDVRTGMEQLDRGEFNEYDEAGLRRRFDKLNERAQDRLNQTGRPGK
jgi:putative addiction module CopG family antidote